MKTLLHSNYFHTIVVILLQIVLFVYHVGNCSSQIKTLICQGVTVFAFPIFFLFPVLFLGALSLSKFGTGLWLLLFFICLVVYFFGVFFFLKLIKMIIRLLLQ